MKLGVCYYPEHWPEQRWAQDAQMMREAGLSIVRIGEFAWAKIEPREDRFEWGWLDRAVDTLAGAGLEIVLGTPTAAPPAWLCTAYPGILPVDVQGRRRRFGSRRHYCPTSQDYRRHTVRIVSALAERYATHPAVTGWQIDNELGDHDTAHCYCDSCAAAFRSWCQTRYQTLDALNDAWGTVFWSQTYSAWEQICPPNLTITEPNPSQALDYDRFCSDTWVESVQVQAGLLRAAMPQAGTQLITTNFMGTFPDLNYHALANPLDFVSWDSYPTGNAEIHAERIYHPGDRRPTLAYDAGDPHVTGFGHDLTRGLKRAAFWVMEQQCGNINWSLHNTGVLPGTMRLWTWHALACGAQAVVYFRWRAVPIAQEQLHSGLLNHDGSIAQGYREVSAMQAEAALMADVAAQPLEAPVALLLDYENLWALRMQPHRRDFSYLRHLFVYYRALQRLGVTADIISPQANLGDYRLVIAHSAYLADEHLASSLERYASEGGQVLLGVRSGFKDRTNRVYDGPLPGAFRTLCGLAVTGWQTLPPGVTFDLETSIPDLKGPAATWAEALMTTGSHVLARYTSGPYAGQAALTENLVGQGSASYLGWYPTVDQAKAILAHWLKREGVPFRDDLPEGLVAAMRGPYTLLLNFTESDQTARVDGKLVRVRSRDLILLKE